MFFKTADIDIGWTVFVAVIFDPHTKTKLKGQKQQFGACQKEG